MMINCVSNSPGQDDPWMAHAERRRASPSRSSSSPFFFIGPFAGIIVCGERRQHGVAFTLDEKRYMLLVLALAHDQSTWITLAAVLNKP